jgi:anti-sigma factor RsiW
VSGNAPDERCFTDFALQEFVAGRLEQEVRAQVEVHAETCDACRNAVTLLQQEAALLQAALSGGDDVATSDNIDLEVLALYLDGALDSEARAQLERRLSNEPVLLRSLLDLRTEVARTLSEQGDGVRRPMPKPPAGEILRMPKRTQPPPVIHLGDRKYGGGLA